MSQPKIAIIVDEKNSHEKTQHLESSLQGLRKHFHLAVLPTSLRNSLSPIQLAERLHSEGFSLILAPVQLYISCKSQVDSIEIQERWGRIWAGYSWEPINFTANWSVLTHGDTRILDLATLQEKELIPLVRSLAIPPFRSGLRGLLMPEPTPIYCENWKDSFGLGLRLDQILSLPEISQSPWKARAHSIRLLVISLWNFFESRDLKGAYFQITASSDLLAVRLTFQNPSHTPVFEGSPPRPGLRPDPAQGLIAFSHFFRAHRMAGQSDYEITAGLFGSIAEGTEEDRSHLIWIDTLHPRWMAEPLNEIPNPKSPLLRVLPPVSLSVATARSGPTRSGSNRSEIKKSEPKLASFLEEFQKRYFEAQYEIRQLELRIVDLAKTGGTQKELREIKLRMEAVAHREIDWIKQLSQALATHSKSTKRK